MYFCAAGGIVSTMMDALFRHGQRCVLACAFFVALVPAGAAAVFTVTEPWVRVAPDAKSAEAYMELFSSDGAKVVGVRSDIAADVAMRPPGVTRATVTEITLPAGKTVKLAPGGYRFALAGLDRSLKLGDRVALVLIVEAADGSRQEIPANAEVRRHSVTDDHKHGHAH
jgi:copper(I)-binding protein